MSGQPLSTLGTNGNYFFGTDALPSQYVRHLTALAMTAMASWSHVQGYLGTTFGTLIGGKTPVTMSMYAAFDSFAIQREMLLTAASEMLPKRYSDAFRATLIVLERAAKERHRFAHWLWGTSGDPAFSQKILLLVDPRHLWKMRVERYRHWRRFRGKEADVQFHVTYPQLDQKLIVAYREDDLKAVCAQMDRAWQYAFALDMLAGATPIGRREIYRRLVAQPEIRQALDGLRPKKTKSKKAVPKPRRVSRRARREAALARRRQAKG